MEVAVDLLRHVREQSFPKFRSLYTSREMRQEMKKKHKGEPE
jgi:hypothetical protein